MPQRADTGPDFFESLFPELSELTAHLWDHPELGYVEARTSTAVLDFLRRHTPDLPVDAFSTTGLKVSFPATGARRRIAVVAELDAVISPAHPDADPATGAVHACGHHTQVTIALAALAALHHEGAYRSLGVDITFVFVPAEEFVDLAARRELREQGAISWFGGKPEALRLGIFDDIDASVCLHAIGGLQEEPTVEVDCDLAGFMYKTITFHGSASHAGLDPFSGTNAFSMATLFTTAIGLMRQQVREDVLARMNPVIVDSAMTTNVIPHQVTVGTDIRSTDLDCLEELAGRVDAAAHGCAQALGGRVEIETEPGYFPFVQDRTMNGAFRAAFEQDSRITRLIDDRGAIAAAGDAGDLCFVMPTVQLSYGGFDGTIHGKDFRLVDPQFVLVDVPRLLVAGLRRISDHLPEPLYRRTYEEYLDKASRLGPVPAGAERCPIQSPKEL